VEGARRSKKTLAAATPLPTYIMEFQSVFAKEDFDILPEHCKWDHAIELVTNFIRPYLHQFSIDSHGLNGYGKPLKRSFDRYQSRLEVINNGRDIRQINW